MNPRCNRSFSNLKSYDQHRVHARNAFTLCASLTMRREIIATRRAGVNTWMNPRCDRSFSDLYSYDQHRVSRVHARNANTLCASLTMRREIVARDALAWPLQLSRRSRLKVCNACLLMISKTGALRHSQKIRSSWANANKKLSNFE